MPVARIIFVMRTGLCLLALSERSEPKGGEDNLH